MFTLGSTYVLRGQTVTVIATATTYRTGPDGPLAVPMVFVSPAGGPITRLVGNETYALVSA